MRFLRAYESHGGWLTAVSMEEAHYATCEASVEAKRCKENRAGVGSCRVIPAGRRRRLSNNGRTGSNHTDDAEHLAQSGNHPGRRGNLRRQSGGILCLRQGKRWKIGGQHPGRLGRLQRLRRQRLWRLQGLRSRLRIWWLQRLRIWWLRRLRIWWLRLHLLPVVGVLPVVLN